MGCNVPYVRADPVSPTVGDPAEFEVLRGRVDARVRKPGNAFAVENESSVATLPNRLACPWNVVISRPGMISGLKEVEKGKGEIVLDRQ
jgi:hypothetical protein